MIWKRKRKAAKGDDTAVAPVYETVDGKPVPAMVADERLIGTSIVPT